MEDEFDLFDIVFSLSNTCDMISSELADHHKRVAYLACNIAQKLNFDMERLRDVFIASLLHDIGSFATNERIELLLSESEELHNHAFVGAGLVENRLFSNVAEIIRYHHVPWENGKGRLFYGNEVPLASHILHLADRVVVKIDPSSEILSQVSKITDFVRERSGCLFNPELAELFFELSKREYLWLNIVNMPLITYGPRVLAIEPIALSLDEVVEITEIFANIIDFRSPFTAKHSTTVAVVAKTIAELAGFSKRDCQKILVAGFLHDLGKLAIGNDILEKKNALSEYERNVIKSHTFYTYRTLFTVKNFDEITAWASLHHERLNGEGYPFHLTAEEIPVGSRIVALADIYSALIEDRPYRKGMDSAAAVADIGSMVKKGLLCPEIFGIFAGNIDAINSNIKKVQVKTVEKYIRISHISV